MKAAIYVRHTAHSPTLGAQYRELRKIAEQKDWEIILRHEDIGHEKVAAPHNNAELNEFLLKIIEISTKDSLDYAVFWNPAHISRNGLEFLQIVNYLIENNIEVFCKETAFDSRTIDKENFTVFFAHLARAEYSIKETRERERKSLMNKRGTNPGRKKVSSRKERRIIEMFKSGTNKHQISMKLEVSASVVKRVISENYEKIYFGDEPTS